MAQVAVRTVGANLGTAHTMTAVVALNYVFRRQRLRETWPSTVAVELVEGWEERLPAHHIDIEARFIVIPKFILERTLSCPELRHAILFRIQLLKCLRSFAVFLHRMSPLGNTPTLPRIRLPKPG